MEQGKGSTRQPPGYSPPHRGRERGCCNRESIQRKYNLHTFSNKIWIKIMVGEMKTQLKTISVSVRVWITFRIFPHGFLWKLVKEDLFCWEDWKFCQYQGVRKKSLRAVLDWILYKEVQERRGSPVLESFAAANQIGKYRFEILWHEKFLCRKCSCTRKEFLRFQLGRVLHSEYEYATHQTDISWFENCKVCAQSMQKSACLPVTS